MRPTIEAAYPGRNRRCSSCLRWCRRTPPWRVPSVDSNFKASHAVVPPGSVDQYIGPSNTAYMDGLVKPAGCHRPAYPTERNCRTTRRRHRLCSRPTAKGSVGQMALTFGTDPEAGTVGNCWKRPSAAVEPLLRSMGPAELNAKAGDCATQFRAVMAKYPFNPNATVQATPADVNGLLKPREGALWSVLRFQPAETVAEAGWAICTGLIRQHDDYRGLRRLLQSCRRVF